MKGRPITNPPSRDSDASFASSRPSSSGIGRSFSAADAYSDRSVRSAALRSVNSFLSSHSLPTLSPKPSTVPSQKKITETLKSLLSVLHFTTVKMDDDIFILLKSIGCPFKINRSLFRAPTPHNWPTCLGVLHWLVQIGSFNEHLSEDSSNPFSEDDVVNGHILECYSCYINGDDYVMDALEEQFMQKLQKEKDYVLERLEDLQKNAAELEAKLEGLRTGPTERDLLEKERDVLEGDVKKFHAMIAEITERIGAIEKLLEDKEKDLKTKLGEKRMICEENEELRKRVELQTFNARDVERMKRELQAVERDIGETEIARNSWEERCWDLNSTIAHTFKELEALSMECNQAMRRLKLGNGFQYMLNAKGSTPAEVMGIEYKSGLKPELEAYANKIRDSSKNRFDELIILQEESKHMATKHEDKKNYIAALQSKIDQEEAQMNLLKQEMRDCEFNFVAEAKKMVEDYQMDSNNMAVMEKEAAEMLKAAKLKLQEASKESEEEIHRRAFELFELVDYVSKYKERMESKISMMMINLSDTAAAVSTIYKSSRLF